MATQRPERGRKAPDSGAVDRHRSPGGRAIAGILAETFRLNGRLLEAGDPGGQVRTAWHTKEVLRSVYQIDDRQVQAPQKRRSRML